MNAADLDDIYSTICHRMTAAGESDALLYLGRLALLLVNEIGDPAIIHRALDAAQLPGHPAGTVEAT